MHRPRMRRPDVKRATGYTKTELRQGKIVRPAAPQPHPAGTANAEESLLFAEAPDIQPPPPRNAAASA